MLTGLRQRDVSLIRLPKPARPDEYERASQEIEDLLRGLPGIVAVYRAGSVSVPGISDLDRIAVIEENARVDSIWEKLSERARYLAMHAPFLVDLATFRRHRWFAYLEPLELSFGTAIDLEEPPLPEQSERLLGAESMVISLLSTVKQASTGVFKVRPSLCQLHNLRHALALARLSSDDAPAAWQLTSDVASLRNDWFTSPERVRADLVKDIAARAVPALLEALRALAHGRGPVDEIAPQIRLGAPWSNVVLTSKETGRPPVTGASLLRLPLIRSARAAELVWRAARPRIALDPAVLALLAGEGARDERLFRSTRDDLVREYRDFMASDGRGYAQIGLAWPFVGVVPRTRGRAT